LSAPYDQIVSIDFETVWDRKTGYSLSMMTTEEYIRHERFHAFGACTHLFGSGEPTEWVRGRDLYKHLQQYDWGRTAILAHNGIGGLLSSAFSLVFLGRPRFLSGITRSSVENVWSLAHLRLRSTKPPAFFVCSTVVHELQVGHFIYTSAASFKIFVRFNGAQLFLSCPLRTGFSTCI